MALNINPYIGYIVGGGLKNNLNVRLTVPANQVREGSFVVVESGTDQFYGLVTDMQLGSTDPRFADEQSENRFPAHLANLLHGQTLFTNLEVMPALMLEKGPDPGSPEYELWRKEHPQDNSKPMPVKTVPAHHSPARNANAGDVATIFGNPDKKEQFIVGTTREQGHPICLNLDKFVQRSSGIFGATGTGKSFLTRIILSGLIQYDKTSLLIFDMHNEYGFDDQATDSNTKVPGLKPKFGNKVSLVGLGAGSRIRHLSPDFDLQLAESQISPADILMLSRELDLRETSATTLDALVHSFGLERWLQAFKQLKNGAVVEDEKGKKIPAPDSVAFWANQNGINALAAEGLHSKLGRVFNASYISPKPPANALKSIIENLQKGKHVILSFGDHETDLDYLLVTNILTRHIRAAWEKMTNDFRSKDEKEPRPLVIVVEEAHKLLNREMASQTTFSTIAREMRKYYVTLLIIDQRPSQIYDEVMSQLGTRISGWLGDDADIAAVLSGLAGRDSLRGMLSRLQPAEEVLLLGWGVPMPIPIRSRRYDQNFWQELLGKAILDENKTDKDYLQELGF